ncbi:MAG: ABC transporter permease subunit [Lonepinella koalarum]|nr:ABC transporter permease subunit [Lonepinella koalarum]
MIISLMRRLILTLLTLIVLSLLSYHILLRDPLNQVFSQPHFYSGYLTYVSNLLSGDLGITYNGGKSLLNIVLTVLPPTLELCFSALLIAVLFGFPLGFLGAIHRQNSFGKTINVISSLGISVPVFWIAPILLYLSALYRWEISAVGQFNLLYEIPTISGFAIIDVWFINVPYKIKVIQNVLQHLVLPTLVLAITPTMEITRLVQQRAIWVLNQNYVKVAGTHGWSIWSIFKRHLCRNTLPVIIPQMSRLVVLVLTQCMLIESIFGWSGIGRWIIDSVNQQDYNSISVGVIVIGLFIILVNTLTDLICFLLDPFNKKGWYAR